MKMNYEALRSLLKHVQDQPLVFDEYTVLDLVVADGFSESEAIYAMKQAIDQDLLAGRYEQMMDRQFVFIVSDLTPSGHRFIESIESDTHWNRVKESIKEDGLPMTLPTITKTIAKVFL